MDTLICAVFKQFGDAQNAFFVETIREFHKAVIKVNCFTSIWSLYGNFVACNCICCFACYVAFFVNRERDACGNVVSIRSCCLRKSIGSCYKFYCMCLDCSIFVLSIITRCPLDRGNFFSINVCSGDLKGCSFKFSVVACPLIVTS